MQFIFDIHDGRGWKWRNAGLTRRRPRSGIAGAWEPTDPAFRDADDVPPTRILTGIVCWAQPSGTTNLLINLICGFAILAYT